MNTEKKIIDLLAASGIVPEEKIEQARKLALSLKGDGDFDVDKRNLEIIHQVMDELEVSDCEEVPERVRQLRQR